MEEKSDLEEAPIEPLNEVIEPPVPIKPHRMFELEPMMLLVYFGINLSSDVLQNQIIYQACLTVFGYNESSCNELQDLKTQYSQEIEKRIEPYSANIIMAISLLQGILPAILGLLAGSWSDKFGRKPVILFCLIGYLLMYVIMAITGFILQHTPTNPWVYVISAIPTAITGSTCILTIAVYSFISDVATIVQRPLKIALIAAANAIGIIIGSLASSYTLAATNAAVVFVISAAAFLVSILYVIFFVTESVSPDLLHQKSAGGFCDINLLLDMFKTSFKKRADYRRAIIWCLLITLGIANFVSNGQSTVFYLFTRVKYAWTLQDYTTYISIETGILVIGSIFGIKILQQWLKFRITSMAFISFCCFLAYSIVYACAIYPWLLYLAVGVSLLQGVGSSMCYSILSNVVARNEIGKAFSLATAISAITPLISSPIYTAIYNGTLNVYPGAFNVISAGCYAVCVGLTAFVYIIDLRRDVMVTS